MDCGICRIVAYSGKIFLCSGFANIVLGTTAGIFFSRKRTAGSRIAEIFVSMPLVFPPIAFGFFILAVFGREGIIGRGMNALFDFRIAFSSFGVFLAAFLAGFPLMVKSVKAAALNIDTSIIEAAESQGAGIGQIVLHIIAPNIRAGIFCGLFLSTARSIGEVGMTLMLGGNIIGKTETISLAIYNAVFEGDFSKAAVLSLLLALLSGILFLFIQQQEEGDGYGIFYR